MSGYARLLRYALREWRVLALILGLDAAASALTALEPWPMKVLVDHALGGIALPIGLRSSLAGLALDATPALLVLAAAVGSLGLFALHSAVDAGLSCAWTAAGRRMVYDLAADLFHRLQRLSLLFHSRRTVGDSLSRLTDDTWCVYTVTEALLISPARSLAMLGALGAVAWRLDPGLAALSFVAAPLLGGSAIFFGRRLKPRARQHRDAQSRLLSFVHQTLTVIPAVQAFGAESRNGRQFRRLAAESVITSQRHTLLNGAYGLVNGLSTAVGAGLVLYVGGQRVLSGLLSVGSLLVFLGYLRSMERAWQVLLETFARLKSAEASIDRVLEVLEADDGVRDVPAGKSLPVLPAGKRGHVRLEGVTFGYDAGHPVLRHVTLEARPGETVALVGATGAGKSTLVSLIPRFFDPWEGRVTLDGVDVREVRLASLRAQVALVLQEPFLLPLTVAENIAYGRTGASPADIVTAAAAANADGFIRGLPQGYDTVIGERGASLSGGEKQRLAIARALLKDGPVLILDEPTSALDAHTEALVLEALERLMSGRTTFIIAHRLSTVRRADRVVVLEEGTVAEAGTHQELLAAGGLYHRLHSLQLPGPAEAVP